MADDGGLGKFQRRMRAIRLAVSEEPRKALLKGANEIADMQRRLAPRDSGDLEASIAVTPGGQQTPPYSQPGGGRMVQGNEVAITAGNTDVRYPHLVEYGTENAPAQPFFWPAYRLLKRRTANRIKRAVSKAIRDTKE